MAATAPLTRFAAIALALLGIAIAGALFAVDRLLAPLKADLAQLRDVRYGLLDPDNWKAPLARAVAQEIARITRDESVKEPLRAQVSDALGRAIEDSGERLIEGLRQNSSPRLLSLMGIEAAITRSARALAQSDAVRASAARLTDQAMAAIERPGQIKRIEALVRARLEDAFDLAIDPARRQADLDRLQRHGDGDRLRAQQRLLERIAPGERAQTALLIALGLTVAGLLWVIGRRTSPSALGPDTPLAASAALALVLLAVGLALPMIEVEARLIELRVELSGETLIFRDQILFHQTKSVLSLAGALWASGQPGPIAIGLLMIVFCALLPIAKFSALSHRAWRTHHGASRTVSWLLEHSSKWSMADVFVIAILMAFIGFDGLTRHQLGQIGLLAPGSETENATRLGAGLYAFIAHVLLAIACGRSGCAGRARATT